MFSGDLKAAADKLSREQRERAERERLRLEKEKAIAERQRQRQAAREEEARRRREAAEAAAIAVSCGNARTLPAEPWDPEPCSSGTAGLALYKPRLLSPQMRPAHLVLLVYNPCVLQFSCNAMQEAERIEALRESNRGVFWSATLAAAPADEASVTSRGIKRSRDKISLPPSVGSELMAQVGNSAQSMGFVVKEKKELIPWLVSLSSGSCIDGV